MPVSASERDEEVRRLRAHVADLYLRTRVLTADPVRLVLELYDAAIAALERAVAALDRRQDAGRHVSSAIHILCELDLFLDFQRAPEFSAALADVYEHVQTILAEECSDPSRSALVQCLGYLKTLRDAWRVVRRRTR